MIQDSPILITGIQRSGSTIIARIINHCGAFGGNMSKRRMYCNDNIHDLIELYLSVVKVELGYIPINWKISVEQIMVNEGYKQGAWMYKDSKLCLMWKVWNSTFPNAKWIIVRRRTPDIIDSCLKTGYMTTHKDKEGWLKWVHEHEKIFVKMIEAGVNCKQVWPERMATGDYQQMKETVEWLGLTWNEDIIKLIEPLMWNSKQRKGV